MFRFLSLLLFLALPANANVLATSTGNVVFTPLIETNPVMLFNTRSRIASSPNIAITNQYAASRISINTPHWGPTNPRFFFSNWYGDNTGAYPIEKTASGSLTITAATLETVSNTTFIPITFNGLTSVVIPAGSGVWSDPVTGTNLSADSQYWVRTAVQWPASGTYFGTYNTMAGASENAVSGSSDQSAYTINTGVTGASRSAVYGPLMCAGQGWDGSPVLLVTGDSIGHGLQENEFHVGNARGDFGYVMRGLDDNASSSRFSAAMINIPGSDPLNDANTAVGYFGRRIAMINGLPNVPFTSILSEAGTNNSAVAAMTGWWTFLKARWPMRIYQTTIPPHTTTASNTAYDTYANQTPVNAAYTYPAGTVWVLNAALNAGTYNSYIDGVIDINVYASGVGGGFQDRWFVPTFTTTLAALCTSNAGSLSLTASPALYDSLVLDSGNSSVDSDGSAGLIASSLSGSGPYTVSLGSGLIGGGLTGKSHSNGAAVSENSSNDGLHPIQAGHILMSTAIINAKNSHVIK